jgi:hypothetical protein
MGLGDLGVFARGNLDSIRCYDLSRIQARRASEWIHKIPACAAYAVYQPIRVNANISVGQPDSQKKRVVEACLRYLAAEFYFSIEHIAQFIESTEATDDFSLVAD